MPLKFTTLQKLYLQFGVFLILVFYSFPLFAYHLPLWEVGIGAGYVHAPRYRGSNSVANIAIPFPFGVYRGDRVKADRDGFRGKLFDSDKVKLHMSMSFNIPVNSDKTVARKGMPNLDPVLEIGPSLNINMWQSANQNHILWFKLPLRAAISIGHPLLAFQGLSLAPYLQIYNGFPSRNSEWRLKLSAGPIFASERYHNYFYEVDSKYSNPIREEYHASGGYSGSRVTLSFARNSKHMFIGIFARYDDLSSATFTDSPLVETLDYFTYGFAIAWVFDRSNGGAKHTADE